MKYDEKIIGIKFGFQTITSITDRKVGPKRLFGWTCDCERSGESPIQDIKKGVVCCGKVLKSNIQDIKKGVVCCGKVLKSNIQEIPRINNKSVKTRKYTELSNVGMKFGKREILSIGNRPNFKTKGFWYNWKCDCGTYGTSSLNTIKHWNSCGCNKRGSNYKSEDFRRSKQGLDLIKRVFQRDDYTCQLCYQIGGTLNSHHIIRWADSKEKRFDISNCLTLCYDCHYIAHNGNFKTGVNLEIQNYFSL